MIKKWCQLHCMVWSDQLISLSVGKGMSLLLCGKGKPVLLSSHVMKMISGVARHNPYKV